MFLIKGGRVKLSKITSEGNEITLDIRKAGDLLGENMLNEDTVFPVTATCLEDTLVCGFGKRGFEELVLAHPNIGLQVIKNLSRRIDWLTSQVGGLNCSHLEERLYQVLVNVAREHGSLAHGGLRLDMPLTHEDLGFLVGAHRVSITRAMGELRRSGRVIQEGKSLIISGLESL
jgi:CRP/FNR family transcriptional regulator